MLIKVFYTNIQRDVYFLSLFIIVTVHMNVPSCLTSLSAWDCKDYMVSDQDYKSDQWTMPAVKKHSIPQTLKK